MTGVTPNGIRYPDGASRAKDLGPELQRMAEDIDGFIDREIEANSPAFLEQAQIAAARAVLEELEAKDLPYGDDERLLRRGYGDRLVVVDGAGEEQLTVKPGHVGTGVATVDLGLARIEPSRAFRVGANDHEFLSISPDTGDVAFAGMTVRHSRGFQIAGEDERIIWDVDSAAGAGTAVRRVVFQWLLGQSNMEGRGRPYGPELDPPDERMLQWHFPSQSLNLATVPLSSKQQQTGLSVGTVIAREVLANEPAGTVVVNVNSAVGNSGLVSTPAPGQWKWGSTAAVPHLADQALNDFNAAMAATVARYPGIPIEVRAFWVQGEADSDGAAYAAALTELVTALRAQTAQNFTFTIGGMVPEYIISAPTRAAIRAAHIDAPRQLLRAGYADGVANGGGSNPTAAGTDLVHYAREAVERLGRAMYAAWRRAVTNVAASAPYTPLDVTATRSRGTATVTWSPAYGRVTAYVVEYSADGGDSWTQLSPALRLDTRVSFPAPSTVLVRVHTLNDNGASLPTTAIPTIGA
ncbi:MAG: hypothetical protein K0R01_147 [Mycobacterium sp.]|jgi:hypothetical protein|nr:hypothetical protein [Mycobacterium sp.]